MTNASALRNGNDGNQARDRLYQPLTIVAIGFPWWAGFYFAACCAVGGTVGGWAGATDPEHAAEAARRLSADVVQRFAGIFLLGSLAVAVVGSAFGILPGTRPERRN
jgi:hypothetical protein